MSDDCEFKRLDDIGNVAECSDENKINVVEGEIVAVISLDEYTSCMSKNCNVKVKLSDLDVQTPNMGH